MRKSKAVKAHQYHTDLCHDASPNLSLLMAHVLLPYHLFWRGYKHLYNTAKVLCHLTNLLFDICTDAKAMVGKTAGSIAQFKAVATNRVSLCVSLPLISSLKIIAISLKNAFMK